MEHLYVDNRPVSEEIADALKKLQSESDLANSPEGRTERKLPASCPP